jgi:DNA-binding NarL/FixJ family response regulator
MEMTDSLPWPSICQPGSGSVDAPGSRVLILQASEPIAVGLGLHLGTDFEVAHFGAGSPDPGAFFMTFNPALLVVELRRDCGVPLSVGQQLKHMRPATSALVVAVDPAEDQLIEALHLDLQGLVVNPADLGEIAECVRRVRHGQLALDQRILLRVVRNVSRRLHGLQQVGQLLTTRELEIVALVGSGCTAKDIANRLFVSEGTIKVHLHNVFSKLRIRTRAQLAHYAREHGLVQDFE